MAGTDQFQHPDEARFQLDYIRVWQRPEDKAAAMR